MSFDGETSVTKEKGKKLEEEEIELSLSLSLNGKFGVKNPNGKVEKMPPTLMSTSPLVRTCSVHVGDGEGKMEGEIEIVRKMAKRKRMERMSIVRGVRGRNKEDLVDGVVQESDGGSSSQGRGSSEVSDITEHQEIQLLNNSSEARTASHSGPKKDEQRIAAIPEKVIPNDVADSVGNESKKKGLITQMANRGWPYVFTTLDDPNHVKVEGFLQKYSHGKPVKIVCVCHGVYHSPAEFVKHAGGDAVENPLKQIVVTLPSVS